MIFIRSKWYIRSKIVIILVSRSIFWFLLFFRSTYFLIKERKKMALMMDVPRIRYRSGRVLKVAIRWDCGLRLPCRWRSGIPVRWISISFRCGPSRRFRHRRQWRCLRRWHRRSPWPPLSIPSAFRRNCEIYGAPVSPKSGKMKHKSRKITIHHQNIKNSCY